MWMGSGGDSFCHSPFLPRDPSTQAPFPLILSTLSGPAAVSLKTLDPRVALAEKCFELYVGCLGGGEVTPKGRPRNNRIWCIGGLFPFCGRKKDVEL